ncbi:MAG TPA: phosphoribosylaminoimidazolesuccinocarboxamide synthase [Bacillota bacterium]
MWPQRGPILYEGKAKVVYRTDDPDKLILFFKDDATAFNGKKRAQIPDKGRCNNLISAVLFEALANAGIESHFLDLAGARQMVVRRLDMIPLEVVVRNIATGSLVRRLGLAAGMEFAEPVLELYYKNDALGDPLINDDHVRVLGAATAEQLAEMKRLARGVNDVLKPFLADRGLRLVDFKLEFGVSAGRILLGDEITPDTCRLWDLKTGEILDKDRFRRDLGGVAEAYQEVLRRLAGDEAAAPQGELR